MSFAILRYAENGLCQLSVFYIQDERPTRVSSSWHRSRAEAARMLGWFMEM